MNLYVQVLVPAKGFLITLNLIREGQPFMAVLNTGNYNPSQFIAISVGLDKYEIIDITHDGEGGAQGSIQEVFDCRVRLKEFRQISGDRKLEPEL